MHDPEGSTKTRAALPVARIGPPSLCFKLARSPWATAVPLAILPERDMAELERARMQNQPAIDALLANLNAEQRTAAATDADRC